MCSKGPLLRSVMLLTRVTLVTQVTVKFGNDRKRSVTVGNVDVTLRNVGPKTVT